MPETKLSRILAKLDRDRMAEVVGNAHDMARDSFSLSSNTVDNYPQFHDVITRYYRHHYGQVFGGGDFLEDDRAHWEVKAIIDNAYKENNGFEGAYENARTGNGGGMHGVLNAVAGGIKQEQQRQYVEHIFYTEIDPHDYEALVELMAELLDKVGFLLTPSERARSPHDLVRNFDNIIKQLSGSFGSIRASVKRY